MVTFANVDSAEDRLEAAGLAPAQISALTEQARDALIFTRRLMPDADVAPGTSKLGGSPDLPEGMAWPTRPPYASAPEMLAQLAQAFGPSGYAPNAKMLTFFEQHLTTAQPLAFLAQVDLSALSTIGPFDIGMPARGRLLVFVDRAPFSVGASPWDDGWIQVIHDTSNGPLIRTEAPEQLLEALATQFNADNPYVAETGTADLAEIDLSQSERLSPHAAITVPEPRGPQAPAVSEALYEAHMADFTHLMGAHGPEAEHLFSDQLGGHPHPVQNDVAQDLFDAAQTRLRPVTLPEQYGRWDAQRWGHLLSIGGESYMTAFPASWGDGDLYIAHRPDPARPATPGQVWAISQQT